jgi:hypothetical protein
MSFKEALFEIHKKDMIPLRRVEIKNELENVPYRYPLKKHVSSSYLFFSLTLWWIFFSLPVHLDTYFVCSFLQYDAHVAGIDKMVSWSAWDPCDTLFF